MAGRDQRQRRITLPWKFAFALYAIAMTIGTHWPRLEMGVGELRASDKTIHLFAFGGLTLLLWRTRWLGDSWLLMFAVLLWAIVFEYTQSIPILGRSFSWWDIFAGQLGVVFVMTWIWALKPVGGPVNRLRQKQVDFVIDAMFARWGNWVIAGSIALAMGLTLGLIAAIVVRMTAPEKVLTAGMIGMVGGIVIGGFAAIDVMMRRQREVTLREKPCLWCGMPCADDGKVIDEVGAGDDGAGGDAHGRARRGWIACSWCGSMNHRGQWGLQVDLPRAAFGRVLGLAVAVGIALGLVVLAMYAALRGAHVHLPASVREVVMAENIPSDMRIVIDLTLLGVVSGVALRVFRARIARAIDRQGEVCRICGYDVSETPDDRGLGRCGECGSEFVRLETSKRSSV